MYFFEVAFLAIFLTSGLGLSWAAFELFPEELDF